MSLTSSRLAAAPRLRVAPAARRNDAELVVELSASFGTQLDPWQIEVLRAGCGVARDGSWAAKTVCCNVSRQNGKSWILTARALAGALLFGEKVIICWADMPWNEEIRSAWARMERLAASPATGALMMPLVSEVDVRAVLPTVRVPTLVVHHTDDQLIPPEWGKYVADHISGAKYVELPGRNVYHCVEPWRESFQEIAEFLTGHQADVADERVLATVLFTDIVDSTRRAAEMGDRDWHALLDAHDAVVRSQLTRFRGREVNTSGDGFLAMFDGPQRAIRCAMAIRDGVQALGIEVRAGLHTGECEVRGDDIGGIGVHIGARVSALAKPNEVLVSSTLRDLVIGSGLEFEERGTHELKGVPGEWRLLAVASA